MKRTGSQRKQQKMERLCPLRSTICWLWHMQGELCQECPAFDGPTLERVKP